MKKKEERLEKKATKGRKTETRKEEKSRRG